MTAPSPQAAAAGSIRWTQFAKCRSLPSLPCRPCNSKPGSLSLSLAPGVLVQSQGRQGFHLVLTSTPQHTAAKQASTPKEKKKERTREARALAREEQLLLADLLVLRILLNLCLQALQQTQAPDTSDRLAFASLKGVIASMSSLALESKLSAQLGSLLGERLGDSRLPDGGC